MTKRAPEVPPQAGRPPEEASTETLVRTYRASLEDAWELWTTKEGLESWWGPHGFLTTVDEVDVRPGGRFRFRMRAVGAPQVAFMQKAGRPLESASSATFREVVPRARLAIENLVDFLPGVEAYTTTTTVDFVAVGPDVRITVVLEAMHDPMMTKFAVMGWTEQLERLERKLAATPKVTPFVWFDDQAEDAAKLYTSIFDGSKILEVTQREGKVFSVVFEVAGQRIFALNGGPTYRLNPAFSLFVSCESQEELDRYWDALLAGGGEPSRCGWLKDRYGLSWQIVPKALGKLLGDPDPARARRAMQAMLGMVKLDIAALERAATSG